MIVWLASLSTISKLVSSKLATHLVRITSTDYTFVSKYFNLKHYILNFKKFDLIEPKIFRLEII